LVVVFLAMDDDEEEEEEEEGEPLMILEVILFWALRKLRPGSECMALLLVNGLGMDLVWMNDTE